MTGREHGLSLAHWRDKIEVALRRLGGTHAYDDIEAMFREGHLQAWKYRDSLLLTEVAVLPSGTRILHHVLACGSMRNCLTLRELVVERARDAGIEMEMITGPPAVLRVLRRVDGWSQPLIQVTRGL